MPKDKTHQSLTSEHYTPPWISDFARHIMGSINFDPFTLEKVNDWHIKANKICDFDQGFDGFLSLMDPLLVTRQKNLGTVFCNPPSEKSGDSAHALRLLHQAWLNEAIDQAVFLAFNLETVDQCCKFTYNLPRLMLRNRLKYWSWNEISRQFQEGQWQVKGNSDSQSFIEKSDVYWRVTDQDFTQSNFATKDEAIAATKGNYKIWTNSPTKHSTILLLPPRTNAGWVDCLTKAQSFKLPVEGYWNIPQFPVDLGAK